MAGEKDLQLLLRNMAPLQRDGVYVFTTHPDPDPQTLAAAIATFREPEGITCILPRAKADEWELSYTGLMAWITLQIHSSLEAVGLTAAVATALAAEEISCNAVAAYYHDHLFVPLGDAPRALEILRGLSADHGAKTDL
ncbi:ACT domain-containing protein [Flavilitoribacter nigricans]|uniref:Acetyltransferase n=1 Tax=Flavilitoribacter nigricans (strain ATCC 23147 / DSM 23189 / NBRC 102662 / NCIMB 1420 / SS-2) TaxID=1122177 RepID=A0A2D0MX54_FLAN2|nr:ACT domain-containing protein [Flavilitoribacter nigricans]PHN00844.1 acetyltransferase [Flavilitoribacter nigricans DSM 23189 = NBRC 102662]